MHEREREREREREIERERERERKSERERGEPWKKNYHFGSESEEAPGYPEGPPGSLEVEREGMRGRGARA